MNTIGHLINGEIFTDAARTQYVLILQRVKPLKK